MEKKGQLRTINCDLCDSGTFRTMFHKQSSRKETFRIARCADCGLVQVNPQPDAEAVRPYYDSSYFLQRSDRGYDNYFSPEIKAQIAQVYELNLNDLRFFEYEAECKNRPSTPKALDLGCAAGYFVEYLAGRGWDSSGVEVSADAAAFGIQTLGLDIVVDDFLSCDRLHPSSYDLVTLWASLEHMHAPTRVMERVHELLKPGGRMILSTCRYGLLAKMRGIRWRYMNVPEHLYFFSKPGLVRLSRKAGFEVTRSVSYGSGLTGRANAPLHYRALKRLADPLVKLLDQGDMIALCLRKGED